MNKLPKSFYQSPAESIAREFLGKYLVHNTAKGKMAGKIVEVEAYPAFSDNVSHGNKRTKRTEIMYKEGGFAYVYLIHGVHYQFAVTVNKKHIPEVVFIRALLPTDGIDIMKENFGKEVICPCRLTESPGKLCKSMGITLENYGENLTGDKLYIEDRGEKINPKSIKELLRVGISEKLEGYERELRFKLV